MINFDITIPAKISFHDWACDLNKSVPKLIVPIPDKTDEDWWGWAEDFINSNTLSGVIVPDKKVFPRKEDWKKWAFFLIRNADFAI